MCATAVSGRCGSAIPTRSPGRHREPTACLRAGSSRPRARRR
jgi:hypothetical protein